MTTLTQFSAHAVDAEDKFPVSAHFVFGVTIDYSGSDGSSVYKINVSPSIAEFLKSAHDELLQTLENAESEIQFTSHTARKPGMTVTYVGTRDDGTLTIVSDGGRITIPTNITIVKTVSVCLKHFLEKLNSI